MKLWDKGTPVNKAIEDFTVGKDRELDLHLATHDI
jgi:argininosuccinate lyase